MIEACEFTFKLGGVWRNGRGQAPCPVCQPEGRRDQNALSLAPGADGRLMLFCFKSGCDFRTLSSAIGGDVQGVAVDREAQRKAERKRAEYAVAKLRNARKIWGHAKPLGGTHGERYLRGRGITCALPDSLRFTPDVYHQPSMSWCGAMVANVSTGGIHRTFFDKKGRRLTKDAKMMLGPCAGGAVRLSEGNGPLVVAEGIETSMALMSGILDGPASVWACLSTSGMKSLHLPKQPDELIVATDGDDPGRAAGDALARRASALGWKVSLLPAPHGEDWADALTVKEVAA